MGGVKTEDKKQHFDDIYVKECVDSISATEFLGGPIVRAYQNDTVNSATADDSIFGGGGLNVGNWSDAGETPLTTGNFAEFTTAPYRACDLCCTIHTY